MAADRAVRAGHGGLVARLAPCGHRSQSRREGPRGGTKPASLSALGTAAGPGGAPTRRRGRWRRRRLGPGEKKKRVRVSKEKNRQALLFLRTQRSAVGFVWTDEIKSGGGAELGQFDSRAFRPRWAGSAGTRADVLRWAERAARTVWAAGHFSLWAAYKVRIT